MLPSTWRKRVSMSFKIKKQNIERHLQSYSSPGNKGYSIRQLNMMTMLSLSFKAFQAQGSENTLLTIGKLITIYM